LTGGAQVLGLDPAGRLDQAVAAFIRQELGAPVAGIIGFIDILLDDVHRDGLNDLVADLGRMRLSAVQLNALIVGGNAAGDENYRSNLRHELRTPLSAIKGYGEMLVEQARENGREPLLLDLAKVLDLAWWDTVNTAKRMETYGTPGRIHVSAATQQILGDAFRFERCGAREIKGKGPMETFFLDRP